MELTLTNNYYTWARTALLGDSATVGSISTSGGGYANNVYFLGKLLDDGGADVPYITVGSYAQGASLSFFTNANANTQGLTSFDVGNDNTPTTMADYALKNKVYDCTLALQNVTVEEDSNGGVTFLVTITASASIVVKEIGLWKTFKQDTTTKYAMLARGVLSDEEAISLAGGETKTLQLTVSLPTPAQ